MYGISVIIPVYNNEKELGLTLQALDDQSLAKRDFEVIVVDDGSVHDISLFLDYNTPPGMNLKYLYQEDKGFCPGTARNLGIRNANSEVCLFLDSGVLPCRSCLQTHISTHKSGYDAVLGYVYGITEDVDFDLMRQIIDSNTIGTAIKLMEANKMTDRRDPLYNELGDDLTKWPVPWVALWGLHFSVNTEFLRRNSIYFDEYFDTWGCEDNDFGINLHSHGARFVLARDAASIHYPATKSSLHRLVSDAAFRENFSKNKDYVANKYLSDRGVQLWYKKGMYNANRLYYSDILENDEPSVPSMTHSAEIVIRIKDYNGKVVFQGSNENYVPYIEQFDALGFRAGLEKLNDVFAVAGKELSDDLTSKYLEHMLEIKKKRVLS